MKKNLLFGILSLTVFSFVHAQSEEEFTALVSLYYSTDGPHWAQPWDLGKPVSEWEGVVLEDGHVVELHLPLNRLQGSLPENFYQLPHLRKLNLAYNQLEGQLSSHWKKMHSLEELRLSQNQLTGSIPSGLRKLKSLKSLYLAENSFNDYRGLLEIREGQLKALDLLLEQGSNSSVPSQLRIQLSNTLFEDN